MCFIFKFYILNVFFFLILKYFLIEKSCCYEEYITIAYDEYLAIKNKCLCVFFCISVIDYIILYILNIFIYYDLETCIVFTFMWYNKWLFPLYPIFPYYLF